MVNLIDQFEEKYNKIYKSLIVLRNKGKERVDTEELLTRFDEHRTLAESMILQEFIKYRQDAISSDIEVVAFMVTIDEFHNTLTK